MPEVMLLSNILKISSHFIEKPNFWQVVSIPLVYYTLSFTADMPRRLLLLRLGKVSEKLVLTRKHVCVL